MRGTLAGLIGPLAMYAGFAAQAQQGNGPRLTAAGPYLAHLPDAPQPQADGPQSAKDAPKSSGQAQLSGQVLDPSGASIVGAEVRLSTNTRYEQRTTRSGADGRFSFEGLPEESYVVTVRAPGFQSYVSDVLSVRARQVYEAPKVVLTIESSTTEVTVRPTEQIAAEQIRAEEKQRVFGIFPSYFTSYAYDAAPLTARQKFSLTAHDTFDPVSLLGVAAQAGIQQASRTYPGYGNDAPGYGKRVGAALGNTLTSDFFGHAVYPALLHQDPRYFYQGSGTRKQRLYHALSFALLTRNDSGRRTPNLSYILGDLTSGALSNLYYPHADRGAGLVFTNTAIGIGGRAAGAVLREFVAKRVTTNVPGEGKP